MRIEGKNGSYDMDLKNHDFEIQVEKYEEKKQSWLVRRQEGVSKWKCSYLARAI